MPQLYTNGDEYCIDGDKVCIKVRCPHCDSTLWVREGVPHVCEEGHSLTATRTGPAGWFRVKEVEKCGDK